MIGKIQDLLWYVHYRFPSLKWKDGNGNKYSYLQIVRSKRHDILNSKAELLISAATASTSPGGIKDRGATMTILSNGKRSFSPIYTTTL